MINRKYFLTLTVLMNIYCIVSSVFSLLDHEKNFWYIFSIVMSFLYNFQGKWTTCLKNMFEERMPIKISMIKTIEWHSYFIKTVFCILKCLGLSFNFHSNFGNFDIVSKPWNGCVCNLTASLCAISRTLPRHFISSSALSSKCFRRVVWS